MGKFHEIIDPKDGIGNYQRTQWSFKPSKTVKVNIVSEVKEKTMSTIKNLKREELSSPSYRKFIFDNNRALNISI